MSDFPNNIDTFRELENLPNQTFDVDNKTTIYAEDFVVIQEDIIAIEDTLGTEVQGTYNTVRERIEGNETSILALEDITPVLISSGSFPASATLDITSIPAGYRKIVLKFFNVSSNTATRRPLIRTSTDGGTSFRTSNYICLDGPDFSYSGDRASGPINTVSASATWDGYFTMEGYEVEQACTFTGMWLSSSGNYMTDTAMIEDTITENIDAIRIMTNASGNFDSGTYELWGYK